MSDFGDILNKMELYHVLNRGVEKRVVFLDDRDRLRFLHDLFVFNDQNPVLHYKLLDRHKENKKRKLLVHIHSFCLMPNHYHILLSPAIENGIPLFMKKLSMGYAKYFNERYKRSGTLWQGKYKRIRLQEDRHFLYILYYIHLNALDLSYPTWRTGNIRVPQKALDYLKTYRWSSHIDYTGVKNFPSITERGLFSEIIGSQKQYEKEITRIITNPELGEQEVTLE